MLDIHKLKVRLKACDRRISKLKIKKNREIIFKFKENLISNGLSDARVLFYTQAITKLAREINRPLNELTKEQIKQIVSDIEQNEKYSEYSKVKYLITIKKFYQFLAGYEWNSKEYPENVRWIRSHARKNKLSLPTILTKDEVLRLFKSVKGIREKAMVSFMYESGCRVPDELLHMKIRDVEFDEYGARVKLCSGKVGERIIRVVSCVPYLREWIENQHPNPNPDSYVWVSVGSRNHGNVMSYSMLRLLFKKWVKEAGINKKVTLYSIRRSRYTHLATKLPTQVLYKYMGQVQGSRVIERYVALNDEIVDDTILAFNGIKVAKTENDIKILICPRCKNQNTPESEYCQNCNMPLTNKAMIEADKKRNKELEQLIQFMINKKMKKELNVLIETMIQKRVMELKKQRSNV